MWCKQEEVPVPVVVTEEAPVVPSEVSASVEPVAEAVSEAVPVVPESNGTSEAAAVEVPATNGSNGDVVSEAAVESSVDSVPETPVDPVVVEKRKSDVVGGEGDVPPAEPTDVSSVKKAKVDQDIPEPEAPVLETSA